MKWIPIFIAGIIEVIWASLLKHANGLFDWLAISVLIAISFILLIRSYKTIPMAAAYTVFVGIGTIGTYLVGIILGDPFSFGQLFFLMMLMAGIIGMKTFTKTKKNTSRGDY